MFSKLAIAIINFYQLYFSPDHGLPRRFYPGGFCRFSPSCSEYTKLAINRYGFLKGSCLGALRICRCNPWHPGGPDPVK